jgi:hypothetical protein
MGIMPREERVDDGTNSLLQYTLWMDKTQARDLLNHPLAEAPSLSGARLVQGMVYIRAGYDQREMRKCLWVVA